MHVVFEVRELTAQVTIKVHAAQRYRNTRQDGADDRRCTVKACTVFT